MVSNVAQEFLFLPMMVVSVSGYVNRLHKGCKFHESSRHNVHRALSKVWT